MVEKFSIKSQGYNWPCVKRKEKKKRNYIPEFWRRARKKFDVWLLNNFLQHSS